MIGSDVAVTVLDIRRDLRGDEVRLGITAPRHVQIHRQEVYEAIMRGENVKTLKRKNKTISTF